MFRLRWKPDFGPVFFELQRFRPILFDPKHMTTYTYKQIFKWKPVLSKFQISSGSLETCKSVCTHFQTIKNM